ncbi:meiosis protein SPO22/ZIP4 like-domain-containing protein [Phaeosphaeriaceae sp. PMI808]|nr:meiosis protein SPO22/ZIP4 like-domain-containing protein [Phaeosphaeriaceae sp. PMI808]
MAPSHPVAKIEREKKLNSVLTFGSTLVKRFDKAHDPSLVNDIQSHIRGLPFPTSSTLTAKQNELDRLGTELWNLSTRLRRDESPTDGKGKADTARKNIAACILRVFSFLLLDSAAASAKGSQRKSSIRLMKVALKAARACIDCSELVNATKILERAAEYQDTLSKGNNDAKEDENQVALRLQMEYFAVRTTLAWRQERMDTAEHMFAKCKHLINALTPNSSENMADLFYEIGKENLKKRTYETAIRWLERAYDFLGDQSREVLSSEASELRLSTMHSIVQGYMKLNTSDAREKAQNMVKLMETDYADKMVVSLLKIELLSAAETIDSSEFYTVLSRMIRSVVLNDTNFKTIMHHIHKLKEYNSITACKILDDLIETRLFQEENQTWIEKAVITRIWVVTTTVVTDNNFEKLQEVLDAVSQKSKAPFSAPATHAAQTLLWKLVESAASQGQFAAAEEWCRICLHSIFEKAGAFNKAKVSRKLIQCALSKQDYVAAREAYHLMPEASRDDPMTRYLMYKAGLQSGDVDLTIECLELVCRSSAKDATLLYACVIEAQNSGDKRQAIFALEKVLEKYDYSAPAGIHLPALLRCTARLLQSELIQDGTVSFDIMPQICKIFEGALTQAKASRRRPNNVMQQLFNPQEFEWFSKNTYNLSLKYCAEMAPIHLVRLLNTCIEFIKLLKEQSTLGNEGDLCLRLVFCEFLAACTYTTLARAEDNTESCLQFYLETRKHSQEFRRAAADGIDNLGGSAQLDIISKYFQVVKLELEAVLKLERWDELDDLFEQCWKYKTPDHYETLADLVLVIHSCIVQANVGGSYQRKVLSVLHKIINLTSRHTEVDIVKLSRWLRCLFNITLTCDESISLKCIDQAVTLATKHHGDVNRYPPTELEWLATTTFNHAVDCFLQDNDEKCKQWAENAFILAQWLEDGGALRDVLMEKYASLKLQD